MAYKIKFKNSVSKDLKKIDKSVALKILDKIDAELPVNADKFPMLKGRFTGLRKFHIGEYRIIYSIVKTDTVLVLRIAHKREA